MNWTTILLLFFLQAAAPPAPAPQSAKPLDGIAGVVARAETVRLIREGFAFTEGPVPTADGGLYFSDLLASDRIHRMAPNGEITVFREKTNAAGGLAVLRVGRVGQQAGEGQHAEAARAACQHVAAREGFEIAAAVGHARMRQLLRTEHSVRSTELLSARLLLKGGGAQGFLQLDIDLLADELAGLHVVGAAGGGAAA